MAVPLAALACYAHNRAQAPLRRTTEGVPPSVPTGSIPQPLGVMGRTAEDYKWVCRRDPIAPQPQPSSMPAAGVSVSTRRLRASIPTSTRLRVVGPYVDLALGNLLKFGG